jgi:hypothetical protein
VVKVLRMAVALLAVLAAGCGGDDDGADIGSGGTGTAGDSGSAGTAGSSGGNGGEGGETHVPGVETAFLAPTPGTVRSDPRADAPVAELAGGLNGAGFDLWRTQSAEGNLVFSRVSSNAIRDLSKPSRNVAFSPI